MGHNSPLAIVNVTRHQLGAIPKESPQGTPRRGLSSDSEDPGYTDVGNDPRDAQRQIWEQCAIENNSPRDPTEVVIVADHTRSPTRVVMASDHHTRRMERESIHTESVNVTKRSQEHIECIQSMAEEQRSSTVKQGVMESISETLQRMNLKDIRRFQQSLPENLSQARRSRRLMGTDPEIYHTTGNRTEDSRIIMKNVKVYYKS